MDRWMLARYSAPCAQFIILCSSLNIYIFRLVQKDDDGHTLKVRQSQDPLIKHYLEHFEKLARGKYLCMMLLGPMSLKF